MHFKAFEDYLQLEKSYSVNTVVAYIKDLESFSNYIKEEFEEDVIDNCHYSQIRSWIVTLVNKEISNTVSYTHLTLPTKA